MRTPSMNAVKTSLLARFSKETLSAAAGALGTALIAGLIYLTQLGYQYLAAETLVGLIQPEPALQVSRTPSDLIKSGSYCPRPTNTRSVGLPTAPAASIDAPDVENWKLRTLGSSAWASVKNQDGVGSGEFVGYKILRTGSARYDTIAGGFKGDGSGRGVYFLQKIYDNGGKSDKDWWRGYHTYFDCINNRVLKCHYILGADTDRAAMSKDPWLSGQCAVEEVPPLNPISVTSR